MCCWTRSSTPLPVAARRQIRLSSATSRHGDTRARRTGALFATSSAINASIFCALEVSRGLADKGQLPAVFARAAWGQGTHGLVWSTGAILVMVNFFDLGAIAQVAGATFLISYLGVFAAHWRLHEEAGGSRLLILGGAALMLVVLLAFMQSLWSTQPSAIWFTVLAVAGSLAVEWLVQRRRR